MNLCFTKNYQFLLTLLTHQPKPEAFRNHSYKRSYTVKYSEGQVWQWLNNPDTFKNNQVWPYRVVFTRTESQKHDFEEGVFNSHHGPLMSFTGVIGEVKPSYRDLKYLYGSYFLSFRWIRPQRLQFWTEPQKDGHTTLTMQLDSYVKPSFYKFWNWSQGLFWGRFGRWANKSIAKL